VDARRCRAPTRSVTSSHSPTTSGVQRGDGEGVLDGTRVDRWRPGARSMEERRLFIDRSNTSRFGCVSGPGHDAEDRYSCGYSSRWYFRLFALARPATPHERHGPGRGAGAPARWCSSHGSAWLGAQFETQAQRFGLQRQPPIDLHRRARVRLDLRVEHPRRGVRPASTERSTALAGRHHGAGKDDLRAHAQGTALMVDLPWARPSAAARVATYVNYDGRTPRATGAAGGVPTLAEWGQGPETREIEGATNVRYRPVAHAGWSPRREVLRPPWNRFPARGRAPHHRGRAPTGPHGVRWRSGVCCSLQNVGASPAPRLEHLTASKTAARGARQSGHPEESVELTGDGSLRADPGWRRAASTSSCFVARGRRPAPLLTSSRPFVRDDQLVRAAHSG
jgi:hypothetical protein